MIQNALSIFRADKQYRLDDWFEENIEECLTVIDCPPEVQRRLRIVTAKAMDLSDEWEGISGKSYISLEMLQLAAEALLAASSQPQNPAA